MQALRASGTKVNYSISSGISLGGIYLKLPISFLLPLNELAKVQTQIRVQHHPKTGCCLHISSWRPFLKKWSTSLQPIAFAFAKQDSNLHVRCVLCQLSYLRNREGFEPSSHTGLVVSTVFSSSTLRIALCSLGS